MITVADIQKDFPDWPAGVIEPWLIEFANDPDMGWPPPEPYGDHRWGRLLGQRPISWWKNVTWTLEKTDCGFDGLTPKAKADVLDIRKEMQGGKPSPTTKRRWDNLFRYVLNDGSFPVSPVVMRRPEGLSPIDGTHRIAVLSGLRLLPEAAFAAKKLAKPSHEQNVWMGKQGRRAPERAVRRPIRRVPDSNATANRRLQSPRNRPRFTVRRLNRWYTVVVSNLHWAFLKGLTGGSPSLSAIYATTCSTGRHQR